MQQITKGRTRGYFAVENVIIDGLLALKVAGIDAVGFYCALKRFIDRRIEEGEAGERQRVMDWSVETFCKKFRIGHDRFYRLMDVLWQVGLVDVEKKIDGSGWQNCYAVHDYLDYEGPVRIIRAGSFRHKKQESGVASKPPLAAQGGIPEAGISETGIPETGIPKAGIPAAGIPAPGITNNTTKKEIQLQEKDKYDSSIGSSSSSSNEEEEEERASRAPGWKEYPSHASRISHKGDPLVDAEPDSDDSGSPGGNAALESGAPLPRHLQRSRVPSAAGEEGSSPGRGSGAADPGGSGSACGNTPDGPGGPPTNRDLIAELVERLHRIPGVEKLRGHYALIGRAYNEYGYQCVLAALDDVEAEYRGAELLKEPYPSEKELHQLLFKKCRWNQKSLARLEGQETQKPKPKNLSLKELEELGCVIERAEDGHPVSVRIPNDEVRRRVRAARGIA